MITIQTEYKPTIGKPTHLNPIQATSWEIVGLSTWHYTTLCNDTCPTNHINIETSRRHASPTLLESQEESFVGGAMTKLTTSSSFFIVVASILLASHSTDASSASTTSSLQPLKSNAFGNDELSQPKRKRRRSRGNRDKIEPLMKSESIELVTPSKRITPSSTNHASKLILESDDEKLMAKGQEMHDGDKHIANTPRKRKRRRRKTKVTAGEGDNAVEALSDDLLEPHPDHEILDLRVENGTDSHQEMTELLEEEGEFHSKGIFPTETITAETPDSFSSPFSSQHLRESDASETITIINKSHHQDISISSKSTDSEEEKANTTTTESEDFIQLTHTELLSDSCTPTLAAVFQSSSESKKSLIKESNDGRTVTFQMTHQRKQHSVQIKTKSRPTQNNESTRKTQSAVDKRTNEPKSSSKTQITGKGGECLRRIKREWKDAVRMGIAYDWTNMRTVTKNEGKNENDYVRLGPFGKNLLRWHFSVMGPANSVYENGIYHGRVLLPKDYPGSPPRVQMLTPSGRFVPGEDICLSASNYHPETWTPRWTVLSLVDALRLHMLTASNEIGGVVASDEKRKSYAQSSRSWCLPGIVDHRQMVADGIFSFNKDTTKALEPDDTKQIETGNEMPVDTDESTKQTQAKHQKQTIKSHHPSSVEVSLVVTKSNKAKASKTMVLKASHHKFSTNATSPEACALDTINENIVHQRSLTKRLVIEIIKLPLRVLSTLLILLSLVESKLTGILDRM
ncbi:hypothetical protein HJC23_009368 [Cyclotella cryptica]|uniref:UBC core domain-containing protein n=1 Tax=Cyclotella cryptica TaxID=29204 RepID=A0ABD3QT67_9STRA